MTNGRLEKELCAELKMKETLETLPKVFSEFYYSLRAAKKSYTTMSAYINYVKEFMHYVTNNNPTEKFYKEITSEDVERYLISLETMEVNGQIVRTGDSIQAAKWSALNTFFEFLVNKKEYLNANPMKKTERPVINTDHEVTYLTQDEIANLLKAIDDEKSMVMAARDRTIICLMLSTGLRVSAVTNINIEDINFDRNVIQVIEKRQKTREISFGEQTKELLKTWIETRNRFFSDADTTALFVSKQKQRITRQAVLNLVKKYADIAGIKKNISPHKLRSTAATSLAASGCHIQTIKKIMGHESISTTQRYIAVLEKDKAEAVNILDNIY